MCWTVGPRRKLDEQVHLSSGQEHCEFRKMVSSVCYHVRCSDFGQCLIGSLHDFQSGGRMTLGGQAHTLSTSLHLVPVSTKSPKLANNICGTTPGFGSKTHMLCCTTFLPPNHPFVLGVENCADPLNICQTKVRLGQTHRKHRRTRPSVAKPTQNLADPHATAVDPKTTWVKAERSLTQHPSPNYCSRHNSPLQSRWKSTTENALLRSELKQHA